MTQNLVRCHHCRQKNDYADVSKLASINHVSLKYLLLASISIRQLPNSATATKEERVFREDGPPFPSD
jgi:hypothetical protein